MIINLTINENSTEDQNIMNSLDERSAPIRVLESQPALAARIQLDTEPDQDPVKLNLGSTIFESV